MPAPGADLRRTLEGRRRQLVTARTSDMARTQVEARVNTVGSGETRATIEFPVLFSRKPIMTFGGELASGSSAEAGNYPVISVMVDEWDTVRKADQRTYYRGCDVLIVALGKERQRVTANVLFEGMAFRDPTVGDTGLTDPI